MMKIRDSKSIIVIFVYICMNGLVLVASMTGNPVELSGKKLAKAIAPEFTEIENLDYFHMRGGVPQISLAAIKMRSQGEEVAEFDSPRGVYNYVAKNKTIRYSADKGLYTKANEVLNLDGKAELISDESHYSADVVKYFLKKDLITGNGNVKFDGRDPKTQDHLIIESETMRAQPEKQNTNFKGAVRGSIERKKKYEGKSTFSSREFSLDGNTSLAHMEGDVVMKRQGYTITSGKADMYLENFNKSLKYLVLNDDVKVTERVETPQGITERKAFAERLEGFGKEQKMVLSGAPRVEMGKDVVKGYRITIRENVDLIEVEDALSDVQVKRKKLKE